jgi:hypothetical protein
MERGWDNIIIHMSGEGYDKKERMEVMRQKYGEDAMEFELASELDEGDTDEKPRLEDAWKDDIKKDSEHTTFSDTLEHDTSFRTFGVYEEVDFSEVDADEVHIMNVSTSEIQGVIEHMQDTRYSKITGLDRSEDRLDAEIDGTFVLVFEKEEDDILQRD